MFDMGWNALREQIFANQKRLGIIPANTELTPWPDGQPEYGGAKASKWETLTADKRGFLRARLRSLRRTWPIPITKLAVSFRR